MKRQNTRMAQARKQLRADLMRVTYLAPYPRFVCDVFLDGVRLGSYARDAKGIVTFDQQGHRFGRRKHYLRSAIIAIVTRARVDLA